MRRHPSRHTCSWRTCCTPRAWAAAAQTSAARACTMRPRWSSAAGPARALCTACARSPRNWAGSGCVSGFFLGLNLAILSACNGINPHIGSLPSSRLPVQTAVAQAPCGKGCLRRRRPGPDIVSSAKASRCIATGRGGPGWPGSRGGRRAAAALPGRGACAPAAPAAGHAARTGAERQGRRAGCVAGTERLAAAPATQLVRRSLRWRLRVPATAAACQGLGNQGCTHGWWAVCLARGQQLHAKGRLQLGWRRLLQ